MNNISRWAIKNPIPVLLLFVLLTIAGISGFSSMKTSFKDLMTAGWRPVALMVFETVWIAGVVLVAVEFFT